MAIYSSSIEMMEPLLGSQASVDDIAANVVKATYGKVNATWGPSGDGSLAMSDAPTLSDLYSEAYTASQPAARRRMMRRLQGSSLRTAEELKPLFDAVARVGGGWCTGQGPLAGLRSATADPK